MLELIGLITSNECSLQQKVTMYVRLLCLGGVGYGGVWWGVAVWQCGSVAVWQCGSVLLWSD